jgi:hypothetical protein
MKRRRESSVFWRVKYPDSIWDISLGETREAASKFYYRLSLNLFKKMFTDRPRHL